MGSNPKYRPDKTTCEHCGKPIIWIDWCYVHEAHGFADCLIMIRDGVKYFGSSEEQRRLMPARPTDTFLFAEPSDWWEDT